MRLIAIMFLFLVPFCACAQDKKGHHGVGHDKYHHWYQTLKTPEGLSCCNDQDCRPTQTRVRDGVHEILVDGVWVPVPMDRVLKQSAPDMGDHVCALPGYSQGETHPHILCVILGNGV